MQFELYTDIIPKNIKLSESIAECIILMRKELENSFTKDEEQKYLKIISSNNEKSKASMSEFVSKLKSEISKYDMPDLY